MLSKSDAYLRTKPWSSPVVVAVVKSTFYHGSKVRPLLDAEGTDVAHRLGKPLAGTKGLNGQK